MPRPSAIRSMTAQEYKEALAEVGLNQTSAARFFGMHGVTGRRWAVTGPPEVVAKFLRIMLAQRWTAHDVDRLLAEHLEPEPMVEHA